MDLQTQFWSSLYPFFGSCGNETENFRVNFCSETSQHSVQTADDKSKVTSQALKLTLVLYMYYIFWYYVLYK